MASQMDPIKCFKECRSGVVQIFLERDHRKIGGGSGFLVSGGIITNSHVIRATDFDAIAIRFDESDPGDQNSYLRVIINDVIAAESSEDEKDYAFLKMKEPEFSGRHLFSFSKNETVKVGQMIAFMGYPFGIYNLTCHTGYISSIYEKNDVLVYQIDGSVNGGNSGGPLISLDSGDVVGIVTRAQTGLIEEQLNNLMNALKSNQQALSKAKASVIFGGFDSVKGFVASQAAMEVITQNLRRSANVGIGYAFSSDYIRDHFVKHRY